MALSEVIKSSVYKNTIVLVPNRYMFIDELQRYLSMIYSGERVLVMNASDFFRKQAVNTVETDHLIVTFFDQSEYLRIKKSYCYKKLTYLLYSFENAWRRGFYCVDMLDKLGLDVDEIVNAKMSKNEAKYPVEKARESGACDIWLTERGNSFGYNNLVVDFRNIPDMLSIVPTVIMDCTHSVQRPSAGNGKTVGDRKYVPMMAKAAKAFGATGYFFEVHPDPDKGLSDAANMLELDKLDSLIGELLS